jgi:tryptophanyl-tRNA synthetase
VKLEVAAAINELLAPMRERRAKYEGRDDLVLEILKAGCERANKVAEATLERVKHHANLVAWPRKLSYI